MDAGTLLRVNRAVGFLYEDEELLHRIAVLDVNTVVIFLGEHVEGMIFYDKCWVSIRVLTPSGTGWMIPDNLAEER